MKFKRSIKKFQLSLFKCNLSLARVAPMELGSPSNQGTRTPVRTDKREFCASSNRRTL